MAQRLGNAPANAALGVEGAECILKDHLHTLQKRRLTLEHNAAPVGAFQAHQQARQGAFAAAAASQQAKALTFVQVQVQAAQHLHPMPFAEQSTGAVAVLKVSYLNKTHGAQLSIVNEWCAASSVRASWLCGALNSWCTSACSTMRPWAMTLT